MSDFNIKDFLQGKNPKTYLVGAGCSYESPSNLPVGRTVLETIIRYSCAESEIENLLQLKGLRFEALIEAFRDGFDHNLRIIDYYDQCDKPNLQHFFLANEIIQGHCVITTNFDFLIEYALLSMVSKNEIIPVITKHDFEKFPDPYELFKHEKKPLYKIHGSTKNIITKEDTRNSLIATIQAFGLNKDGLNVFQVEPFKQPLFDNISTEGSLVVMGYSGSDDFDIIPTLHSLKNIREVIWINHINEDMGSAQILKIQSRTDIVIKRTTTKTKMDKLDDVLWELIQSYKNTSIPIYRIDVNTTRLIGELLGTRTKISAEPFALNLINWLKNNLGIPNQVIKNLISSRLYIELAKTEEAQRCLKQVLQIADKLGEQRRKGLALNRMGEIDFERGNYSTALIYFETAHKIAMELNHLRDMITYQINIGRIYKEQGLLNDAIKQYNNSLQIAYQLEDLKIKADIFTHLGTIYESQGKYNEAMAQYKNSFQINEQLGLLGNKARDLGNIGAIFFAFRQFDEAMSQHKASLGIAEQLGNLPIKANQFHNIARIYHEKGISQILQSKIGESLHKDGLENVNKAIDLYKKAISIFEQIFDPKGQATVHNSKATLHAQLRMFPEAITHYESAFQILIEHGIKNTPLTKLICENLNYAKKNRGDN